mmetsp:Transcript_30455/g.34963  ORF Transcript_30455/g.34963 Transcript_30455/m.34963 type:complete len:353 (-) Transcript_30455:43-1101(-)
MMKPKLSSTCLFLVITLLSLTLNSSHGFVNNKAKQLMNPFPFIIISHQRHHQESSAIGLCGGCRPPLNNNNNYQIVIRQPTKLDAMPIGNLLPALAKSLFRYQGNVPLSQAFALNAFLFAVLRTKLRKMLTTEGIFHSLFLGTALWTTLGWRGWTTCVMYLFLGSTVTKVKFKEKEKLGIAEGRGGRRGPENVWGSAATGLLCALCFAQGPKFLGIPSNIYTLGYVASLATKLSDTFASEIGKAYGKTTFLITTLERVPPGTEGAVSVQGTAASIVGGALISMYGFSIGLITFPAVPISIVAAFIATNIESVLGATLQGKENLEWITNEVVNFVNTLIGAAIAIIGGMVFFR